MKKLLIAIPVLLALFVILVFAFVPGKIVIAESKVVSTTAGGFDTCLHNLKKWKQWWPGTPPAASEDSIFTYNKYSYSLSNAFSDGGTILVRSDNFYVNSRLQTITKSRDSITVEWHAVLETSNNPFTRLPRYLDAKELAKNMQTVFDSLCNFAGKTENIYGFHIERTTFTEINLAAYQFNSTTYPTIATIYDAINKLRQYITSQGAAERYHPMINTKHAGSTNYETMIAISVDKPIQENDIFFMSYMVAMKDRFLTTEITGGAATLERAHLAIEKYMRDHALSAPARPFDILVTDRSKETDTTKWRTKVFYPSM